MHWSRSTPRPHSIRQRGARKSIRARVGACPTLQCAAVRLASLPYVLKNRRFVPLIRW
jgi:hypothetical protein